MTTKLDSPVRRETLIVIRGRLGNVTLLPADPATGAGDAIELQLKGTQQTKLIPLAVLFEAAWPLPIARPERRAELAWCRLSDRELETLERVLSPFKVTQ
jgi:hypothetical protein